MHEQNCEVQRSRSDIVLEEVLEQPSCSRVFDEPGEQLQQALQFDISSPSPSRTQRRWRTNHFAWLQHMASFSPSIVLENSGSVARDHLAAERTFLAYVRTSLGCAAAGVALMQLIALTPKSIPTRLQRFGQYLGAVIEVFGLAIMVIAIYRYFGTQKALIGGKYLPAGMVIWVIALPMAAIIVVVFGLMLGIVLS